MKYQYADDNCKVQIFLKDQEKLLANATVLINITPFGPVTIKSFQIWKSHVFNERLNEPINILPTSIKRFKLVFFEDISKWFELERIIFEAYSKAKSEKEDLNIDEIDKALSNSNSNSNK